MTRRSLIALFCGPCCPPSPLDGWPFRSFSTSSAEQPLQFSHKTHVSEAVGLACDDCHGFRADGSFAGIPGIAKCAECHAEPLGESAEEKRLVAEYVTPQQEIPVARLRPPAGQRALPPRAAREACRHRPAPTCHGAARGHRTAPAAPDESHQRLQSRRRPGPRPATASAADPLSMQMSDCESCHALRKANATACLDCHK